MCYEIVASWQHCFDYIDSLNSVQHQQPKCLEDRLLPDQNKEKQASLKKSLCNSTFPNSGSPKCDQMTCTAHYPTTKRNTHSSHLKSVHLLAQEIHRKMSAQRCPCQLLVFKETFHKRSCIVLIPRRQYFQHALLTLVAQAKE